MILFNRGSQVSTINPHPLCRHDDTSNAIPFLPAMFPVFFQVFLFSKSLFGKLSTLCCSIFVLRFPFLGNLELLITSILIDVDCCST